VKKGMKKFQVGFPQVYVKKELQKTICSSFEVVTIMAFDRQDAAKRAWKRHSTRWISLMETCSSEKGFTVALTVSSGKTPHWRLSYIPVAFDVNPKRIQNENQSTKTV
jgi:uncharacterized membrane protein YsdA (DUF1294 family)